MAAVWRLCLLGLLCAFAVVRAQEEGEGEQEPTDCSAWEAYTDNPEKSALWQAIASRDAAKVIPVLKANACAARARSQDGRGPLFWAHEFGDAKLVEVLTALGADPGAEDMYGNKPSDMASGSGEDEYEDSGDYGEQEDDEMEDAEEEEEEEESWRDEF
eukprot:jgi/Tetstr1/454895/TSEL_041759.t1